MTLKFYNRVLGPLQNNVCFLWDEESNDAVVVDPGLSSSDVRKVLEEHGWTLRQIWLTHAHGDHGACVAPLQASLIPRPQVLMHADSLAWDQSHGRSFNYGIPLAPLPPADRYLRAGDSMTLNEVPIAEVREVPGHCPGSLLFYLPELKMALVGDVIFHESIGRTDLPGGDYASLLENIRSQVFSLPDDTVLLPGHGKFTTVAHEKRFNPFLLA